ncbi:M24 family metallopeptidase [Maricaulis parjimensis]|uniref:M24 family metallopeptidase n=1 Tax=Maricaulis parjimensis TaxID=144023 RepID=UPI001939F0B8|nr:Xaa-Pro peptidase family protein [Maricaulis parjimensis]
MPDSNLTIETKGVGGSTAEAELAKLNDMLAGSQPISEAEYRARIAGLQERMQRAGYDVVYLDASSNLTYYTGTYWPNSERLVGALIPVQGDPVYIGPAFETGTIKDYMGLKGELAVWDEHEDPYALVATLIGEQTSLALDPTTPLFRVTGLSRARPGALTGDGGDMILHGRARKSPAEIALLQAAKTATLEVHKAAARILRPGISTLEVTQFIHEAHKKVGAPPGSGFCIVLFGPDTAFPHGVAHPKTLEEGDMVLIDTGCSNHGYQSDITRSYVFGTPTAEQRRVWEAEKACQAAAFEAAQLGVLCGAVDTAARRKNEELGFGPDYALPGIPHRTGHGIGLDIHEAPYLVASDMTPLDVGMCFSNEPMISVPGQFGIRLEDHFYMAEDGPRWFTQPSKSIDDPFG